MPDFAITWSSLGGVIVFALTLGTAVVKIQGAIRKGNDEQAKRTADALAAQAQLTAVSFNKLEKSVEDSRKASEDGRRAIYEKLDRTVDDMRRTFVSREVHDRDIKLLDQGREELDRRVDMIAERIDRQCPLVVGGKMTG